MSPLVVILGWQFERCAVPVKGFRLRNEPCGRAPNALPVERPRLLDFAECRSSLIPENPVPCESAVRRAKKEKHSTPEVPVMQVMRVVNFVWA